MGSNIAVVAKFEVISVKKLTEAIKKNSNKNKFIPSNKVIWVPIHRAKPLSLKPEANAYLLQIIIKFPKVVLMLLPN